jgi:hypothetical protein
LSSTLLYLSNISCVCLSKFIVSNTISYNLFIPAGFNVKTS